MTGLLDQFDAQMRREPWVGPGLRLEAAGGVVRLTGAYNVILYSDLTTADADAAVRAQAEHFSGLAQALEWKLHGHDRPADLADRLAAYGFAPDEAETVMVMETASVPRSEPPVGITIRQARDAADVDQFLTTAARAFGSSHDHWRDELLGGLEAGTQSMHIAWADGEPVGAGRLDLYPGRKFAGAFTGGVVPAWRGRGVYRALVASRADQAAEAGFSHLYVEARETSRPILQRLGFEALTTVQGWVLEPAAD